MPVSIKQTVIVRAGGVIEMHSPDLHEGDEAQVTVVVTRQTRSASSDSTKNGWKRFAGAVNSGNPHAGDNESIDADLASEYGGEPHTEA